MMHKLGARNINRIDAKISGILAILSFIAGIFVLPYQLETLPQPQVDELLESVAYPLSTLTLLVALQLMATAFLVSFLGLKLARKTGLNVPLLTALVGKGRPQVDTSGVKLAVAFGMLVAFTITTADRFYFGAIIPMIAEATTTMSFYRLMAGIFYGGVFEEVLLRLFFMSLLTFLFSRFTKGPNGQIPSLVYLLAIIVSAVVFAIGHFPATRMIFGELTTELAIRGLLLNSVGGLFFGYLYWRRGLEYGILAHMVANTAVQLIFVPIFY